MTELERAAPKHKRPPQLRRKTSAKDKPQKPKKPQESPVEVQDGTYSTYIEISTGSKSDDADERQLKSIPTPQPPEDIEEPGKELDNPPLSTQSESSNSEERSPPKKPKPKTEGCIRSRKLRKLGVVGINTSIRNPPNTGLPTPPWTPIYHRSRTPSLYSSDSKPEETVCVPLTSRQKFPITPPNEEPPPLKPKESQSQRYVFERKLGTGAYGEVYLCKGPGEWYYATKTLKPVEDKRRRDRQQEERRLLELFRNASNPPESIIKFFEAFEYGGSPFENEGHPRLCLVQELCRGPTLAHVIKAGRIKNIEKIKSICRQTLAGLCFFQDHLIVHCDLKPENIMFKYRDPDKFNIRIIDVGLSLRLKKSEQHGGGLGGTAMYHPREAFGSDKIISCKIDIWSFGVILWEMFHGLDSFPISPISSNHARKKVKYSREVAKYQKQRNDMEFKKEIKYDTDVWKANSEAIPFAKGLLEKDLKPRLTAREALAHIWLETKSVQDPV